MTVTPDYRIQVSRRIREEFDNGREYYRHHDGSLASTPDEGWQRRSQDFIRWHNQNIYRC